MRNATHISILLDRSGSMGSIVNDVIGGYNNFLSEQKAVKGDCTLTLVQFDSEGIDTLYEYAPIADVPELTTKTYQPRGATPLLDALGKSIESTGRALENISEADRPDKIIFVVITDGEENASNKFTKARIKEMIEQQEKQYAWNFIFLGANQDAFAEAGAIGVQAAAAANFAGTGSSMRAGFAAMSMNSVSYRGSSNSADLHWTPRQRAKLMDDDLPGTHTTTATTPKSTVVNPTRQTRLNWKRRGKK